MAHKSESSSSVLKAPSPARPQPSTTDAQPIEEAPEVQYLPDISLDELDALELPAHVTRLKQFNSETGEERRVFLVGTAHISLKSAALARSIVTKTRPDTLMLELCRERVPIIASVLSQKPSLPTEDEGEDDAAIEKAEAAQHHATSNSPTSTASWMNTVNRAKAVGLLGALIEHFYASISASISALPGVDFRAALRAIRSLNRKPPRVSLCDRPVSVTLKRTWHALSLKEKLTLCFALIRAVLQPGLVTSALEDLEDADVMETLLKELGNQMPSLLKPLLDERNKYMVNNIRHTPGRVVVVVVGRAHVPGMVKLWDEPIDANALMVVPSSWITLKRFVLGVLAIFFLIFALIWSWLFF